MEMPNMRLTLRTLLAYLDDTLGPAEIKAIGEKVAESDAAQELIARIKQVTRRRRLTTPPTSGTGAFDPNDVAEYLDNELDAERIADIEKICLESDVHLAEIAACHQILTLVLGEPALVPPKAKERMYKLVRTRESIPFRKAAPAKKAVNADGLDDEEELELGGTWLRWVLPIAGVLLIAALGTSVYLLTQSGRKSDPVAVLPLPTEEKKEPEPKPVEPPPEKEPAKEGTPKPPEKEPDPMPVQPKPPEPDEPRGREAPPSLLRRELATYRGALNDMPTVLMRPGTNGWESIPTGEVVHSTETLSTLPGFSAVLVTNSGVNVALRGHLPAFSHAPVMSLLLESTVVLHAAPAGIDLDLTLVRGRIYLRNNKEAGPCKIRLRFDKEVWDVRLALPGDEVGVDLVRLYNAESDFLSEPPRTMVVFFVTRGDAQMDMDAFHSHRLEADGGQAMFLLWDSFRKAYAPQRTPMLKEFNKNPPAPEDFEGARRTELRETLAGLKNLQSLVATKPVKVALREALEKESPALRIAAVFCLAAVDDPGKLLDVLGSEQRNHAPDRNAAIYALRHWLSAEQDRYKLFYDREKGTGLLVQRGYKESEAKNLGELIFDLSPEFWTKPETFYALARSLEHRRIAIAELGYWHLNLLSAGVKLPEGFNAALPIESREKYAKRITEMIDKRLLPPAPPMGGGAGSNRP
jgi:hypothetical protein